MNKSLNRRIIVAGVIALLVIWVCLAFNNMDWAVLYAWIMIGGGICVLVATNIIILAAKNGENEIFEPKISKQEMPENGTIRPRPVELNEISKALEGLGYNVAGIEDGFIYFSDGHQNYSLHSHWRHRNQINYMGVYLSFNVKPENVEEFRSLAWCVTESIRIAKMYVIADDENNNYSLDVLADSFYTGDDSLNATILALMDSIAAIMNKFEDLRAQMQTQKQKESSTADYKDIEQQMALNQNKTKYEC